MPSDDSKILVRNAVISPLGGIRIAGLVRNGIGVPVTNRILNRYALVYVFDGSGVYADESVSDMPVSSGDVIQILPNTKHWYGPLSGKGWDEVYIVFEGPAFDLWYEKGCLELGAQVTTLKPIDYWKDRFLTAAGRTNEDGTYAALSEVLRVQSLLIDLQKASQVDLEKDTKWLEQAKHALANQEDSRAAAQQLGMRYEAFRKRFRKLYGIPPGRYHANLMMEKACNLLTRSPHSIREIASLLDYCDEFHFSKQFNKLVGCSPSTYRARTCKH